MFAVQQGAPTSSPDTAQGADQKVNGPAIPRPAAAVPRLVRFSGALKDATDKALTGPLEVTFSLYKDQGSTEPLWWETQLVEADSLGRYAVLLGAMHPEGLPMELFTSGEARWLGVSVGKLPEEPRVLLVSVPYALKAGDAETLGGKAPTAYMLAEPEASTSQASEKRGRKEATPGVGEKPKASTAGGGKTTPKVTSGTVSYIGKFIDATSLGNSVLYESAGKIGLGTTSPAVALDISGNNASLRLIGTGTHQVTVTGATSGRLGQDTNGFFFASDTNGKAVRFLANNGTLNEWMRITSAGNVGIGTTAPAQKLQVVGNVSASGSVTGAQLVSTVATGTPPLAVTSTTQVANLNASLLGGLAANGFATLGTNTFVGNQGITGNLSVSGSVSGASGSFNVDGTGQITTPSVGTGALVNGSVTVAKLAPDHLTIPALAFTGLESAVTASQAVVSPGDHSVATPLRGWAPAVLPQGSTITGFTFCGRDNDDPGQITGNLKRRPITGAGNTFASPDVMATLSSGTTFFSNDMVCLSTTTISSATIDNTLYAYYAEIQLDGIVQAVSVTIDH